MMEQQSSRQMSSISTINKHRAASRVYQPTTPTTALTAMGIVYGDLGTSPLYTLPAVAQVFGGKLSASAALGSLSLIIWLLIISISIKYCLFVMRADNHGEGGILALMSLTGAKCHGRGWVLVVIGLFGAALLYGDGIITPSISVLSALEGLNVATDFFKPHVTQMAVVVLVLLFAAQSRGTATIGQAFGPVMLLWFITLGVLGIAGILRHPGVLAAINPAYALMFLTENPRTGFVAPSASFLAITGGEALYADMGHIGRPSIRTVWFGLVLSGDAAWLVSRPPYPPDFGRGVRTDIRAVHQLDDDGLHGCPDDRLRQLRSPGGSLRNGGLHHHAAHDRLALSRDA
jgi:KUP system potassium uptake protein